VRPFAPGRQEEILRRLTPASDLQAPPAAATADAGGGGETEPAYADIMRRVGAALTLFPPHGDAEGGGPSRTASVTGDRPGRPDDATRAVRAAGRSASPSARSVASATDPPPAPATAHSAPVSVPPAPEAAEAGDGGGGGHAPAAAGRSKAAAGIMGEGWGSLPGADPGQIFASFFITSPPHNAPRPGPNGPGGTC
jgi:hypothetical protein